MQLRHGWKGYGMRWRGPSAHPHAVDLTRGTVERSRWSAVHIAMQQSISIAVWLEGPVKPFHKSLGPVE
jgi:hypothetical protein